MGNERSMIRLEEELAFQERRIEALHEALLGQQRQLDKQAAALARLEERLSAALLALEDGAGGPAAEKPPHYL